MLYNNTVFPLPPWLQHHLSPYPLLQRLVTVSSLMSPRLKNIDILRVRGNEWEASITSIYISSKMSSNRHPVRDSSLLDNLPIKMRGRREDGTFDVCHTVFWNRCVLIEVVTPS